MRTIVFTGGGTAGHATPNLALIARLRREGWNVAYIGSSSGIERRLAESLGVSYFSISTGKWRRYFDWNNAKDPFRVVKGVADAFAALRRLRPDLVFSKGGYVAVPVVWAAWLLGIPVVVHESDVTPGLANRLSAPFARFVCVTFPETAGRIGRKAVWTGLPVREELFAGKADVGRSLCGFPPDRPVVLVMGGSQGSKSINAAVRSRLDDWLRRFCVIHICGEGNVDPVLDRRDGYRQFAFAAEELPHLLAAADIVVSRAGSTSIHEFLALRKPMLLVPLGKRASRGDQLLNADSFARRGFARVVLEEELDGGRLLAEAVWLYEQRDAFVARMAGSRPDGSERILELIRKIVESRRADAGR